MDHAEGAALGIASNRADLDHWWSRYGVTMDDFRADVARLLEQEDAAQEEEEEPSMTREEITQLVKQDLEEERDARIFRNLADVPDWAAATAQKLVERGALQGDGKALNLSYDLLRTMVALDRQCKILDAGPGRDCPGGAFASRILKSPVSPAMVINKNFRYLNIFRLTF